MKRVVFLIALAYFDFLLGQSCPTNLCSSSQSFDFAVIKSSEVQPTTFNLQSWLGEQLGNSEVTVPDGYVSSDCQNYSYSSGQFSFDANKDCQITVKRIQYSGDRGADINRDNIVDDADLLEILFNFGSSGQCLNQDIDYDGIVSDSDLLTVLFCFGMTGSEPGCRGQRIENCEIFVNIKVSCDTSKVDRCGVCGGDGQSCVDCDTNEFSREIRTMDLETKKIKGASYAVLDFVGGSRPGRTRRNVQREIENLKRSIHNNVISNWTFMWSSLPKNLISCSTTSSQVQCTETNYSQIYAEILRRNRQIVQQTYAFVNRHKRLFRDRQRDWREIQRRLARLTRLYNSLSSFISSLPQSSVLCQ
ncbi:MAG: hypothetical protein NZO16_04415 [Deltaproteobacteria bacterium]|nr:hypothetical protein [Deltaproteobacteria bacterium]